MVYFKRKNAGALFSVSIQEDSMDEDSNCGCGEKHSNHLCVLHDKGLIRQVKTLTCKPNVECEKCNRVANSEDHVCMPAPLFV